MAPSSNQQCPNHPCQYCLSGDFCGQKVCSLPQATPFPISELGLASLVALLLGCRDRLPSLRLTHKDSHTTREARNTQATRNRSVFKYLCALEQATPLSKLPGLPLYDGPLSPLHSCSEKGNTVIRVSSQQTLAERISGPNVSQG